MKNIILGTAGHIDHGKTTFIKALTGIDCDRLKEEKERGITIELGYAKLLLPTGIKVGIVDVPGHEKFVNKMVAGAAGIDVVAMIIAADEGIKPQTKEHLYICDLLGIKNGIIVLTKKDLVDEELLELQKEDIREFVKDTFLKDAPIVPVSSITGEGIPEFICELEKIAANITEKPVDMPFRMPIDAVISIKGFGTVVRGTVISGLIKQGEEVVILPDKRFLRVRGLQSHGEKIFEGRAGERLAINFSDVEKEELERGMVVVKDGFFEPTQEMLVSFYYLAYNEKPLKSRFKCQFHIFTSRINAEVYLLEKERLDPGEKTYALVKLEKPAVVTYGDNFVIRGYGIYTTLGGGMVLNPKVLTFRKDYYSDEYFKILSGSDISPIISLFVKEADKSGLSREELLGQIKVTFTELNGIVDRLKDNGILYEDEKNRLYHKSIIEQLKGKILECVAKFHKENPMKLGINKDELRKRVDVGETLFSFLLNRLVTEGFLNIKDELVSDTKFKIEDSAGDILNRVEELFNKYGLTPSDLSEAATQLNVSIKQLKEALTTLVKQGRMQKISDNYYITTMVYAFTKEKLIDFFKRKDILTPQDMRELFGISRKYIIPLLEFFDNVKFTIRVPEGRRLRK